MIVPMKKLNVFFLGGGPEKLDEVGETLRGFGALHIEVPASESQYRNDIERALNILSSIKKQMPKEATESADFYVHKTLELFNEKKGLLDSIKELEKAREWYGIWGGFSLATVKSLRNACVFVTLYEIAIEDFDSDILKSNRIFVIGKSKAAVRIVQISYDENEKLDGVKREAMPDIELADISGKMQDANNRISQIDENLRELASYIKVIKDAVGTEDKILEFDAVRKRGIVQTELEDIHSLQAFIPAEKISEFETFAKEKGWGYSHRDPVAEDEPPTLLKTPKIIQPVHALYDVIGLNTGYYEADVSLVFYLFFIVFTALLIGDAGYGSLFLIATIVGHIKSKKPDFKFLTLGYILSAATIVWGALIGNWFGSETIAALPSVQKMTVPELASFDLTKGGLKDSTDIMMRISFAIAITHLSIAHLITFWRQRKSLDAIGQLAWVSFLWGIYFLLQNLIFKAPLHPYFMHQMVGSMVLILFFSDTKEGILNGLKSTALTAPFDFIGGLSDVASYLRLFAVGTAALMLASVFNNLAEGAGIFAPLLLLVGHVFNIVLALFGVFVHATRLETVEFSNHAQLEWAGKKYKPFKV